MKRAPAFGPTLEQFDDLLGVETCRRPSAIGTFASGPRTCAGSLGVSAMVLASAELFTVLKLLGAAYLIWMGVRTLQAARPDALAAPEGSMLFPGWGHAKLSATVCWSRR